MRYAGNRIVGSNPTLSAILPIFSSDAATPALNGAINVLLPFVRDLDRYMEALLHLIDVAGVDAVCFCPDRDGCG